MEDRVGEYANKIVAKEAQCDTLELTKLYLNGFRGQKEYVANLIEQQADMCYEVQKLTNSYGENIGHGSSSKPHPGEILAEDSEYQKLKKELFTAKRLLERIERTTSLLALTEKRIIELRYFEAKPETWNRIAEYVGYTERQCRRLHVKALRFVAISMFGLDVVFNLKE